MFVGVIVREKVVGPPERSTMIYGTIYEMIWLWRYNGTNMAPPHENFSHAYRIFFHMTLLEFALVSENAIKYFTPWDPTLGKFLGGGGPTSLKYKVAPW